MIDARHRLAITAIIVLLEACAPSSKSADTTASLVPPPDTVKPAAVSAAIPDTSKSHTTAATQSKRTGAKQTTSKQTTSTQTKSGTVRDTTILGRDSVMIFDPKDPRRQLPPVKKPPL